MGQQKSDSRKTFKEKFVPPELSMITYFMTKPFVDVNSETEFGYNSDDSMSSEEGGDSDEDIEEDLNRPRTLYVYLNTSKHFFKENKHCSLTFYILSYKLVCFEY